MPRKSDTADKVLQAADELLEQGIRPTQQNVRERIGTGSISTINKALNLWWQQLGRRIKENETRPDLPEPVISAANKLWQQSLAYAEHAFSQRKSEMDRHYQALNDRLEEEKEDSLRELNDLRAQNLRLMSEKESAGNERQALQQQIIGLENQVIQLTNHNDNLNRELKQQVLLAENRPAEPVAENRHELVELTVSLRISEQQCARQADLIEKLSTENETLRKQNLSQERNAISKQHRLETVIAQQDVRYDQVLKELKACQEQ